MGMTHVADGGAHKIPWDGLKVLSRWVGSVITLSVYIDFIASNGRVPDK